MACVDKLLIKGIRSFSPDNENVIDFYKPLTLIVGQNGAGKTTIIECLKMACAGSLPPNTRSGHSFIHDPKVAGQTEVKAQIRLRIRSISSSPVVIIRSFQLTQKAATMQFKALDQVIQTINKQTGEKQAMTYKCADIDKIIPDIMGVSKAILDNVIFVHQDEANWPLGDSRTLKEKFDDVFAATKYTKTLEVFRKLRLERVQQLKVLKVNLEHLKTHKINAEKLTAEIKEAENNAEDLQNQMANMQKEIADLDSRARPIEEKLSVLVDLGNQVVECKTQHKALAKHNTEMFAKLKDGDYEEDTEQLKEWAKQFDENTDEKTAELSKIDREIQNANMDMASMKEQHTRSCKRQGKLQAESDAYKKNVKERDEFIRGISSEIDVGQARLRDMSGPLSKERAALFRSSMANKVHGMETSLAQTKTANRSKDSKMSEAVDSMSMQISGIAESIRLKREQMENNAGKIRQLERQVSDIMVSDAILEDAKRRQSNALDKLERHKKDQECRNLTDAIEKETRAIENLQRKISQLRQERDTLSSASESETRLAVKRQELLIKEQQLESLIEGNRSKIRNTLKKDVSTVDLQRETETALNAQKAEFDTKTSDLKAAQDKESQIKGMLNSAHDQLKKIEQQLADSRQALKKGMLKALGENFPEDRYLENLNQHTKDSEKMVERVSRGKAGMKLLAAYVKSAEDRGLCPLCKRDFNSSEKENFLREKNQEIEALPGQIAVHENRLREIQQKMAGLKELQPLWVRYSDMRDNHLPEQMHSVNTLNMQLREQESQVEDLEALHALAKYDVESTQAFLNEIVWPASNLYNEIQTRKKDVRELEGQTMRNASTRNVSDVDRELDSIERDKSVHERAKDDFLRQQNKMRDAFVGMSDAYRDCKEEVEKYMRMLRKRNELKEQVRDVERQNGQLTHQIEAQQLEHDALIPQRDELMHEREKTRKKAADRELEMENRVRKMRTVLDKLESKMAACEEYEKADKASELIKVERMLKEMEQRLESTQKRQEDLEDQRRSCEDQIRNQEELKRAIQDCLDWRKGKKEEQAMLDRLKELEREMREVGDHSSLMSDFESIQETKREARSKYDVMRGSLGTIKNTLARAERDLAAPQYRDIDTRFEEDSNEVARMEGSNRDLEVYAKAMEKALLIFHKTKMEEINKIIKELWQKTYRAQDIDYIQIKADSDSGSGHRSYNYRLVMHVSGAELEMRGRCSAGQRVLACILVRLALAETFCLNCGILALDEPTTNLDAPNSASLADALRMIIDTRRQQENFQLVVITHDERFAQLLGTREHAEYMWRVTKDGNQHSLISREDVD